MPKFFETSMVFDYSWNQVAQGFWRRYPNPNSNHVLTEDTISREVKSGKLLTKRLLSKTNSIPKWATKLMYTRHVFIVEESICDPKKKELITYTRNLGYTKVMSVVEKVTYSQSQENPNKTVALRHAWIDSEVRGLSRAICAFGYERFRKNAYKMVGGFNIVLQAMFPQQNTIPLQNTSTGASTKLKDAATKLKDASDLAKSKAAETVYASLHANKS